MDHQLIGVLFLSLSHLYLFIPSFVKSVTFLRRLSVCLSVCLSVSIFVYLSICLLKSVWPFNSFLSVHSSDYLPFHLSIYLSFLPFWPLVCLTVCLWVRLSNLSFCPLIDFGLFKIKIQDQGHFLYAFLKSFHVKKNISKKYQNRET